MSTEAPTPTPAAGPPASQGAGWKWIAGAAVVVALIAIAVAVVVLTRDDSTDTTTLGSQRVAATRDACRQWYGASRDAAGPMPPRGWCDDMAGWMTDQMTDGRMMGTTMWASPRAMVDACRSWAATSPTSATTATTATSAPALGWCDAMVGWMSQHMGTWSGSEDWDDHMDDGHWDGDMMR